LSRACLGKIIVFIYKWLKNAVFRRSDGTRWRRSSCACQCLPKDDPFCNAARCTGAAMSPPLVDVAIRGKPWIIFFHGGAFKYFTSISGNYYAPSARLAKLSGMGVLNVCENGLF